MARIAAIVGSGKADDGLAVEGVPPKRAAAGVFITASAQVTNGSEVLASGQSAAHGLRALHD
jgi:hypothetical protein